MMANGKRRIAAMDGVSGRAEEMVPRVRSAAVIRPASTRTRPPADHREVAGDVRPAAHPPARNALMVAA